MIEYQTSGVSPSARFESVFYEPRGNEVGVSLTAEINRLLFSVYSWVRVMYVLRFKRGIKISSSYLCPGVRYHRPTVWKDVMGVMARRFDVFPTARRAGQTIYKEVPVRFKASARV